MKKNNKLELKKETISVLSKIQSSNVVGGGLFSNESCEPNSYQISCYYKSCVPTCAQAITDCCQSGRAC